MTRSSGEETIGRRPAVLKELGGDVLQSHPSAFWFPSTRMLLTVYVDDLMLSGPAEHHDTFWLELMKKVKLDDPEPVRRFLGRYHEFTEIDAPLTDIRDYFTPQVKAVAGSSEEEEAD